MIYLYKFKIKKLEYKNIDRSRAPSMRGQVYRHGDDR